MILLLKVHEIEAQSKNHIYPFVWIFHARSNSSNFDQILYFGLEILTEIAPWSIFVMYAATILQEAQTELHKYCLKEFI
jgi:hypothetical protein